MGKATNAELFTHVQRFVREVYADQLRQAGFSSYKGEDIHWFRLVNNEVIHAIYFVTDYAGFPVMLKIGYGCHPLFIPPILQRNPYVCPMPGNEQMCDIIPEIIPGSMPHGVQRSLLNGLTNKIYRVPDVMVNCPADRDTSRSILEKVLSVLDPIKAPATCYEAHKRWRGSQIENSTWLTMTPYFVDEVVYWEDQSLYPYCMSYVNGKLDWLEHTMRDGKLTRKADREELSQLFILKEVFDNNEHQKYMQALSNKASKHLSMLQKYTSIRPHL